MSKASGVDSEKGASADRAIQAAIDEARRERELAARPKHRRVGVVVAVVAVVGGVVAILAYEHAYAWLIVLGVAVTMGGILFKLVADTPPHNEGGGGD